MTNDFLVYCHMKPDTGDIFYIGKGKKHRIRQTCNRNKYWHNTVNKHGGFKSNVIAAKLTETEALNFERLIIGKLKNAGIKLCNLTDGGDGISGYKFTEEQSAALSKNRKGRQTWNKGKKLSDAHREKLRLAKIGIKQSAEHIKRAAAARVGRKVSDETKAKISAANTGYKHTDEARAKLSKPVLCVETGQVFSSVTDAAKQLGLYKSNISRCCKGVFKQTGGYTWKYVQALTS